MLAFHLPTTVDKEPKKNSRIDCSLIFVYSDWVSQILADKQIKKAPNLINKGFRAFKITFVCYSIQRRVIR